MARLLPTGTRAFERSVAAIRPAADPDTGFILMSRNARPLVIAIAFTSSLLIGLLVLFWAMGGVSKVTQPAAIGGPFQLTDQNGNKVTEKNLTGKPTLIFFGYTH